MTPDLVELTRELVAHEQLTDPESAKGRLLKEAAHLFKHRGYERTTVRDLAASVGMKSGSLFHHFRNKEEILCAVMVEAIIFCAARMEQVLKQDISLQEKLLALIICELEAVNGITGEAFTILVSEWRSLGAENQEVVLDYRNRYEMMWLAVLDQARDAGLMVTESFIQRRLLMGAIFVTDTWFRLDGDRTIADLAEDVLQLIIKQP